MKLALELFKYPSVIKDNLEEVYIQSDISDHLEGSQWYPLASSFCQTIAEKYSKPYIQICGITAALSPLKEWGENKKLVEQYLNGVHKHTSLQINKAHAICRTESHDEILKILNGPKISNFFGNIYNPKDERYCTIDRHMIASCTTLPIETVTSVQYEKLKKVILEFSYSKNYLPSQIQGILWLTWKRIKPKWYDIKDKN
jgi:hypothetical protein